MTLAPASSHGSTFSGGTISPTTDPGLAISVPDTTNDAIAVLASDHASALVFGVDSAGDVAAGQVVASPAGGAAGLTALQAIAGTGNALQVISANTKYAVRVQDHNNTDLLRINDDRTVGFFAAAPVAQPAAADLAAALAALGLVAAGARGATLDGGVATTAITSGVLPTVAPVSGTAFQCSTTRDVFLTVPVTYNPGVATTATCKVELSPDNVTFSTLLTITQPVGTVFDGSIEPVTVLVPAAWRVKLTVVNATLGTGTYY